MSQIIIGIHGLGNKPPKRILERWWKKSIREGLKKKGVSSSGLKFGLVYWADLLHSQPLNPRIKDPLHPLYIEYPYVTLGKDKTEKKSGQIRAQIRDYLNDQLEHLILNDDGTINFSSISDFIIRHFFSDLDAYYKMDCKENSETEFCTRDAICSRLEAELNKHKKKKICLIAHSMGSIIAYDVLTKCSPDINIDTFVTIGSPLGLPVIKNKIISEMKKRLKKKILLKTPENILSSWYNLSDLNDKIAFNYNLSDEFTANSGKINVVDQVVENRYIYQDKKNPHKSYGYLQTPEIADIIYEFLQKNRSKPLDFLKQFIRF